MHLSSSANPPFSHANAKKNSHLGFHASLQRRRRRIGLLVLLLSPHIAMRAPAVMASLVEKKTGKRRGRLPKAGGKSQSQLSLLGGFDNAVYQGHFEVISLKGSYLLSDEAGSRNRTGGLSIVVSTPCGSIFGGSIGGPLIAANPWEMEDASSLFTSASVWVV